MMVVMMPDVDASEEGGEQCQGCNVGPDIRMLYIIYHALISRNREIITPGNR